MPFQVLNELFSFQIATFISLEGSTSGIMLFSGCGVRLSLLSLLEVKERSSKVKGERYKLKGQR